MAETALRTVSACLKTTAIMEEVFLDASNPNKGAKKLKSHRKKLAKTQRSIHLLYAGLLVGFFECVPLGILQGKLIWKLPN